MGKGGSREAHEHPLLLAGGKGGAAIAAGRRDGRASECSSPEHATCRRRRRSCGSLNFWETNFQSQRRGLCDAGRRTCRDKGEDVLLRQACERTLIRAAQYLPAHPVPPELGGGLQDEVAEHPRAHVVRGCSGGWVATDCPEEEPDTSGIGIVPRRMGPTTEHVVRKRLKRGRIAPVSPTATHRCSKKGGGEKVGPRRRLVEKG
jgi:hypothetical protein